MKTTSRTSTSYRCVKLLNRIISHLLFSTLRIFQTSNNFEVEDPQVLLIDNATLSDQGWYSCIAANNNGHVYRSAYLHVIESKNPEKERDSVHS